MLPAYGCSNWFFGWKTGKLVNLPLFFTISTGTFPGVIRNTNRRRMDNAENRFAIPDKSDTDCKLPVPFKEVFCPIKRIDKPE